MLKYFLNFKFYTMKKRFLFTTMLIGFILLGGVGVEKAGAQYRSGMNITFQNFYDDLSPYGRWMQYPDYGYVWMPNVDRNFRPYSTRGRWIWNDDYEWMWASDYDWGWATFHYGRWMYDPYYGWLWVPGYEWSPAWVAWRDGGDYYGWAPLQPGINININFSLGRYNPPMDYWNFAPRRYIYSRNIYDYCLPYTRNNNIFNQTTIINNYNYGRNIFRTGPNRRDAERYIGGNIQSVNIRESNNFRENRFDSRRNEMSVYRPSVDGNNDRNFAPSRYDQANPNAGRNGTTRFDQNENGRYNNQNMPIAGERDNRFDNSTRSNNNADRNFGNNGMNNRRQVDRNVDAPLINNRNQTEQRNNSPVVDQPSQPQRNRSRDIMETPRTERSMPDRSYNSNHSNGSVGNDNSRMQQRQQAPQPQAERPAPNVENRSRGNNDNGNSQGNRVEQRRRDR